MLIVPVEQAEPGMVLAAPVQHPGDPQQDLLKCGYVLEAEVLPRLRDLGIIYLYVNFPGLDDLDRHLAVQLSPARQMVYKQVRDTMAQVQGRIRPAVAFPDYYAATRELVTTLMSQGQHPVYLDTMARMGNDAVGHATAVAHLSLMLGLRLEPYLISQRKRLAPHHAREVVNLGVAGMLHDLGKVKLPEHLRDRSSVDRPETEDDAKQWEQHARLGYDMIRGGVESSASAAVLHHHQHYDGSGFPTIAGGIRPEGHGIHVFARILQVADLFDRLTTPPAGAGAAARRSNLEVLHLMRTYYANRLDPVVFRTLQSVAPPFLPGSTLGLSDGTVAVVTAVKPTEPFVPVAKRMKDDRKALAEEPIDFRAKGAPIIETIGGVPVAGMVPAAQAA